MRTSRISREAQRVTDALSSGRRVATRRSLRRSVDEQAARGGAGDDPTDEEPEAVRPDVVASPTDSTTSSLGKRKRALTATVSGDGAGARRSSRTAAPIVNPDKTSDTKRRRQPAKHIKGPNGAVTVAPPSGWEEIYAVTRAMRKRVSAPVDTMGCERLADKRCSPRDQRLQTLVALMMSSQTKDTVTATAMKNLQQNLPGGLCLESLLDVDPRELDRLIEKVGFHNNKTKFLKSTAVILRDQFHGDIPSTIPGLVSLPGVGPKMAYLCMSAAWGRDEGIGVDVHVHRITNLWRWHKTSTPEQTRAELEAWLPRDKWHEINTLLVGLGQTICLPVSRRCGECDLASERLCPSAARGTTVKKKATSEVGNQGRNSSVKVEKGVVERNNMASTIGAEIQDGVVGVHAPVGATTADIEDLKRG